MSDMVFDLFGNPVRPGMGGRGRPAYEATEKDRNKVKLLLAVGWSNSRIANALAISLATLKRYFRAELKVRDQMRDRLEAARLEKAMDLAQGGNVGAMRQLDRLIDRQDIKAANRRLKGEEEEVEEADPVPTSRYVGKKELARKRAEAVTSGETDSAWGDLLKPGVYEN